jgi:signal transduction histidine kinase
LRTPLAQTRRSLEQGVVGATFEEKHAALEQALAQTDRTLAAFTALADITRAEGGLSRDTMEDTDLRLLANDVRELFEPLAEERHIDLVARFQAVRLKAHKPLLMQAMSNLLHNAIKYAPSGSQVTLDLTPNGEGAEFVVGDHGPGIPAERRGDAVQRFKRVGQANQGEDGLGLGLAIVDACARLHGGALVLEDNAPGLRARFSLSGQ